MGPYGITYDTVRDEAFVTLRQEKQVLRLTLTISKQGGKGGADMELMAHVEPLSNLPDKPYGVAVFDPNHLLVCCRNRSPSDLTLYTRLSPPPLLTFPMRSRALLPVLTERLPFPYSPPSYCNASQSTLALLYLLCTRTWLISCF